MGAGIGLVRPLTYAQTVSHDSATLQMVPDEGLVSPNSSKDEFVDRTPDVPFYPRRTSSWWVGIEDLQWPEKSVKDKIKRRAYGFAEAKIDMALNFGFHIRFDFSNYFGQIHGYYANVCEELHQCGIKFMDHYSCNYMTLPRNVEDHNKLVKFQRQHTLLFHDPIAATHAQYEGHFFRDLCTVDLRDGSRGYAPQYMMEAFCYNNPGLGDMHIKYLRRLLKEVPLDAVQIDDYGYYPGLAVCGCHYCRERFKRDYGQEIPSLENKDFWGDTGKHKDQWGWGNYENPAFRDYIQMRKDGVRDHYKLIKSVLGNIPLMTCCAITGPIYTNSVAFDLEQMTPNLDFFMLENCGFSIGTVDWVRMEAEAMQNKDIARQRGAPVMALGYTIYKKGGYLGWALARFWGVSNWSSTLNGRLEVDPPDKQEIEDIMYEWNNWEVSHSNLDIREGRDSEEVRLVSNSYCKNNGWRDDQGRESWNRIQAWSTLLLRHNIGYRFLRTKELSNPDALKKEKTPLILDGIACISDNQYAAISSFLAAGGNIWLALPFGTHDEKGYKRKEPLSERLIKSFKQRIVIIKPAVEQNPLPQLIASHQFEPVVQQISGGREWVIRIRFHSNIPVIHLMNTAMQAIPHPSIKDIGGTPILLDINSAVVDGKLSYRLKLDIPEHAKYEMISPETADHKQVITITKEKKGYAVINVDMSNLTVYGVIQPQNILL